MCSWQQQTPVHNTPLSECFLTKFSCCLFDLNWCVISTDRTSHTTATAWLTSSGTAIFSSSDNWNTLCPASNRYGPPFPPRPAVSLPPVPPAHVLPPTWGALEGSTYMCGYSTVTLDSAYSFWWFSGNNHQKLFAQQQLNSIQSSMAEAAYTSNAVLAGTLVDNVSWLKDLNYYYKNALLSV